jgi:phosphatidylserine/phosphatidylglycerophosphate/cardiolipin synthase-like enzyme
MSIAPIVTALLVLALGAPGPGLAKAKTKTCKGKHCTKGDVDQDGTPNWKDPEPGLDVSIELVESIPVETEGLDWPEVRNTQEVWLEMLGKARSSLDIGQFYINDQEGEPMAPVVDAVVAAARRGVQVRIVTEASMAEMSKRALERFRAEKNISVVLFDITKVEGGGGILHAKYFIVDRKSVFVGSQNFDWKALKHIHELGLHIESRNIATVLGRIFEADYRWAHNGEKTWREDIWDQDHDGVPDDQDPSPIIPYWASGSGKGIEFLMLLASPQALNPQGVAPAYPSIISLLDDATENIEMQVMSYSVEMQDGRRWTDLDDALRRAVARGVKVRMNIADWSKKPPRIDFLKDLVKAGVEVKYNTIPPFSGGWIDHTRVDHSKYMVVDGKVAWLGTSNWSGDYFLGTRNIELIFKDDKVVPMLAKIFEAYWAGPYSEVLDPAKDYPPPVYKLPEQLPAPGQ